MRRPLPPPTKEGNTGERIDTNTFVANTGTLRYLVHLKLLRKLPWGDIWGLTIYNCSQVKLNLIPS